MEDRQRKSLFSIFDPLSSILAGWGRPPSFRTPVWFDANSHWPALTLATWWRPDLADSRFPSSIRLFSTERWLGFSCFIRP